MGEHPVNTERKREMIQKRQRAIPRNLLEIMIKALKGGGIQTLLNTEIVPQMAKVGMGNKETTPVIDTGKLPQKNPGRKPLLQKDPDKNHQRDRGRNPPHWKDPQKGDTGGSRLHQTDSETGRQKDIGQNHHLWRGQQIIDIFVRGALKLNLSKNLVFFPN